MKPRHRVALVAKGTTLGLLMRLVADLHGGNAIHLPTGNTPYRHSLHTSQV